MIDLHKAPTTFGSAFGHIQDGQEGRALLAAGQRIASTGLQEVDADRSCARNWAEAVQSGAS